MGTILAIVMVIVFGALAAFAFRFLGNIAGLPGALLAGKPGVRSQSRFYFGAGVAAIGQSAVYLTFLAFIVNWTHLAAVNPNVVGWIIWPVSFFATVSPLWWVMIAARVDAKELPYANPQSEGMLLTVLVAILAFFVFAFAPGVMKAVWGWLPYMSGR